MAPSRLIVLLAAAGVCACTSYPTFDSTAYLRQQLEQRLGAPGAATVEIPFALDRDILDYLSKHLKPSGSETRRAADITDFVFSNLDLKYRLRPTRDAIGTFRAREGNCLSFVNLFVGIARANRLNAFYVEVVDAQRWSRLRGFVLSQGHIVAGMNVDGKLRTYDFLPYSAKAYRDFRPIDDITGDRAFLQQPGSRSADRRGSRHRHPLHRAGEAGSLRIFRRRSTISGFARARAGRNEEAERIYLRGLQVDPDNGPILRTCCASIRRRAVRPRSANSWPVSRA